MRAHAPHAVDRRSQQGSRWRNYSPTAAIAIITAAVVFFVVVSSALSQGSRSSATGGAASGAVAVRPRPTLHGFSVDFVLALDTRARQRWGTSVRWYVDAVLDEHNHLLHQLSSFTVSLDVDSSTDVQPLMESFAHLRDVLSHVGDRQGGVPLRVIVSVDGVHTVSDGDRDGEDNGFGSGDPALCCGIAPLWNLAWRSAGVAGGYAPSRRLTAFVLGGEVVEHGLVRDVIGRWQDVVDTFAAHDDVTRVGWYARPSGVYNHSGVWLRQSYVRTLTRPLPQHAVMSWLSRSRQRAPSGVGKPQPWNAAAASPVSLPVTPTDPDTLPLSDVCTVDLGTAECEASDGSIQVAVGDRCAGSGATDSGGAPPPPGCFVGAAGGWDLCTSGPSATADGAACTIVPDRSYKDREAMYRWN
jgi:hypothetical protein